MLLNRREPIALHCPVIELAPVPGLPMLPVISARLMRLWAVRTPSWLWLTPIVHQIDTRLPSATARARARICSGGTPVRSAARSGVIDSTYRA